MSVKLEIGGRERVIRFTMRSYAGLQSESERIGLKSDLSNLDPTNMLHLTGLLWAGLLPDDHDLSFDEVLDWETNPAMFAEQVAEAFSKSMGEATAPVDHPATKSTRRKGRASTGVRRSN